MTTTPLPLNDLEQGILDQKATLEQMQNELKMRQAYIRDLEKEKRDLEKKLAKVQEDIEKVKAGEKNPPGYKKSKPSPKGIGTSPSAPKTAYPEAKNEKQESPGGISGIILEVVKGSKGPMSRSEIVEAVLSQELDTTSKDPRRMIKKKISELANKKGLLEQVDEGRFTIGDGTKAPATEKPAAPTKKSPSSNNGAAEKGTGKTPEKPKSTAPLSLKDYIIEVLKRSRKPLQAQEIANRVLERGYETTSKDFRKRVAKELPKMPEVERSEDGSGYSLNRD